MAPDGTSNNNYGVESTKIIEAKKKRKQYLMIGALLLMIVLVITVYLIYFFVLKTAGAADQDQVEHDVQEKHSRVACDDLTDFTKLFQNRDCLQDRYNHKWNCGCNRYHCKSISIKEKKNMKRGCKNEEDPESCCWYAYCVRSIRPTSGKNCNR